MKATVNIGTREVTIKYSIDDSKSNNVPFEKRDHNWEMLWKTMKSKRVQCIQKFSFRDADEWLSVQLLDGRVIDFHYDYDNRSEHDTKEDWASYIFQGYLYIKGEEQLYENQLDIKIKIVM